MDAANRLTYPDQEPTVNPIGQQGLGYAQASVNLTSQETGGKWTGQPQYRYLCKTERHVCRVWKCWIHQRTKQGVTVCREYVW